MSDGLHPSDAGLTKIAAAFEAAWNALKTPQQLLIPTSIPTLTSGSILFSGGGTTLSEDPANFVWDNTNKRQGIGTASPVNGKLEISGDDGLNALYVAGGATTGQSFGVAIDAGTNSSDGPLRIRSHAHTDYFYVRGDGNVGIGTTSPGTALEVAADRHVAPLAILRNTGTGSVVNGLGLYTDWSNSGARNWGLIFNAVAGGDFTLRQSNTQGGNPFSAGTDRFYIDGSGNVGIGTTTPGSKLSIVGLPTSSAGLSAGDIWVDTTGGLNILKIV